MKDIFSSPISAVVNFIRGGDSDAAEAVRHNAQGGIYEKGAFLTTFAEQSAEAAIPLDGSRRAISLWAQAGERLGMIPQASFVASKMSSSAQASSAADTSTAVAAPSSTSGNVQVDFNPTINVSGNADTGVIDMIRQALIEQKRQFERELPNMIARMQAGQRRVSYE